MWVCYINLRSRLIVIYIRLHGQAVKTSPFHGGNTGSIPVGVTQSFRAFSYIVSIIWCHSQVVRQRSATPLSPVQIRVAPLQNPEFSILDFFYQETLCKRTCTGFRSKGRNNFLRRKWTGRCPDRMGKRSLSFCKRLSGWLRNCDTEYQHSGSAVRSYRRLCSR